MEPLGLAMPMLRAGILHLNDMGGTADWMPLVSLQADFYFMGSGPQTPHKIKPEPTLTGPKTHLKPQDLLYVIPGVELPKGPSTP